jgi:hypothetical protein
MPVGPRKIGFCTFTALAALLGACGGKVVVDGVGAGGGGSTTVTSATTGVAATGAGGGSADCAALLQDFQTKLDVALTCNPAIDMAQCTGAAVVADTCDCQLVAGESSPEAVSASQLAHDAWVAAGCGPFDCDNCPPGPSTPWQCDALSNRCTPSIFN